MSEVYPKNIRRNNVSQKKRQKQVYDAILNKIKETKEGLKEIDADITGGDTSEENLNKRDALNSLLSGLLELEQDASKMDKEFSDEYILVQTDNLDCHIALYINPETDEVEYCVASADSKNILEDLKTKLEKNLSEKIKNEQ